MAHLWKVRHCYPYANGALPKSAPLLSHTPRPNPHLSPHPKPPLTPDLTLSRSHLSLPSHSGNPAPPRPGDPLQRPHAPAPWCPPPTTPPTTERPHAARLAIELAIDDVNADRAVPARCERPPPTRIPLSPRRAPCNSRPPWPRCSGRPLWP
jgi:hypothetical protein